MKKLSFLLILLLPFTGMFAQKNIDVPKAVTDRMMTLFPQMKTTPVTWEKNGFNYRGTLELKDYPGAAVIDSSGKIILTERKINPIHMPADAKKYLDGQYKNYEIIEVWSVSDDKAKLTYRATVRIKEVLSFDKDGGFINPKK
jgi:hypothetical protein